MRLPPPKPMHVPPPPPGKLGIEQSYLYLAPDFTTTRRPTVRSSVPPVQRQGFFDVSNASVTPIFLSSPRNTSSLIAAQASALPDKTTAARIADRMPSLIFFFMTFSFLFCPTAVSRPSGADDPSWRLPPRRSRAGNIVRSVRTLRKRHAWPPLHRVPRVHRCPVRLQRRAGGRCPVRQGQLPGPAARPDPSRGRGGPHRRPCPPAAPALRDGALRPPG